MQAGGSDAVFEMLAATLRDEKKYPLLFEARVMKKRRDLGLPLIQTESPGELPAEKQRAYDEGFIAAAREVGGLFLADGEIPRAWPYFRAIGDPAPVAAAIEKVQAGEGVEPVIEIAFQEGVSPYKGFELILQHHGICRAISSVDYFPARQGRDECVRLLVRTLHRELVDSLKRTIAQNEAVPETENISELIAGRDWLFGEYAYYVDTSHLVSILRYSIELDDYESLRKALEMSDYGSHLSAQFSFRGDPPFENIYTDHAVYLRTLLGEDVDAGIAHFRAKAAGSNPEESGTAAAEVLVTLLARLKRYAEAIAASLEYIPLSPGAQLSCPAVLQLCQLAGDYEQLRKVARERGDIVSFAAAAMQGDRS